MVKPPELLGARECAVLLLLLVEAREASTSRLRVSELTLRRLWGRGRVSREFIDDVQEWLERAGWTLFATSSTFAMIRTEAVTGWVRLSSKRMVEEIASAQKGEFDFSKHYGLLNQTNSDSDD